MIKKNMVSIPLTIIVSFFLFEGLATSEDKLNVVSFKITNMIDSPTKGAFIEIVRTAAKRANIDLNIRIYPPKRAQKEFISGKCDMLFPATDVVFPDLKRVIRSKASLDIKKDYAFVRKGTPIIKTLDGLKGKRIGLIRGYIYINAVTRSKDVTIYWANTQSQNLEKLSKGRIDVTLGDWRSAEKEIIKLGLQDKIAYNKNYPIFSHKVYCAFQNNKKCKPLAKRFSDAVLAMQKDGTSQRIKKKYLKAKK